MEKYYTLFSVLLLLRQFSARMVERDLHTALMLRRSNIERRRMCPHICIIAGKLRTRTYTIASVAIQTIRRVYPSRARPRNSIAATQHLAPSLFSEFPRRSATTRDTSNFSLCLWSLARLCCARVDTARTFSAKTTDANKFNQPPEREKKFRPLNLSKKNSYSHPTIFSVARATEFLFIPQYDPCHCAWKAFKW